MACANMFENSIYELFASYFKLNVLEEKIVNLVWPHGKKDLGKFLRVSVGALCKLTYINKKIWKMLKLCSAIFSHFLLH